MNTNYENIIVGAGPGGLACATELAKNGKSILILEKEPKEKIGDKVCAEGLTAKDFRLGFPKSLIKKSFNQIGINFTRGRKGYMKSDIPFMFTVSRQELAEWQISEAEKTGAEVRFDSKVIKITKESVELSSGEVFAYHNLVGADGSTSIVRRYLGLPFSLSGVGFHYKVPEKFEEMELYMDVHKWGPWYAWIFPNEDFTSIGSGGFRQFLHPSIVQKNLTEFCRELKVTFKPEDLRSAPVNCAYEGYQFENVYLIGDASGIVSGLTGEGIYQSAAMGIDVANKIINPNFATLEIKDLLRSKKRQESVFMFYGVSKYFVKLFYHVLLPGLLKNKKANARILKAFAY